MIVRSAVFPDMEVGEDKVLTFPTGLFGFPQLTRFAVWDLPGGAGLQWLQPLDDERIGFVILDPAAFFADYTPVLPMEVLADLGLATAEAAVVMTLTVVPDDFRLMTANLAAPLVINPHRRLACQVILTEGEYALSCPVFPHAAAAAAGKEAGNIAGPGKADRRKHRHR